MRSHKLVVLESRATRATLRLQGMGQACQHTSLAQAIRITS